MAEPGAALRCSSALLFGVALLLISCSEFDRGRVYNETDAPIVVRLKVDTGGGPDRGDVLVTLKPGEGRTFFGASLRNDRMPVTVGVCTYIYHMDGGDFWGLRKAGLTFPIELDITRDMSLDLRPEATKRRDFRNGKAFGFPRQPISMTCSATR